MNLGLYMHKIANYYFIFTQVKNSFQSSTFTEYQSLAVNSLLGNFVTVNYLKVYSPGNCFTFAGGVQNPQLETTLGFVAF